MNLRYDMDWIVKLFPKAAEGYARQQKKSVSTIIYFFWKLFTGIETKNCWKRDCSGIQTETNYEIERNFDCKTVIRTEVITTKANGQTDRSSNEEFCSRYHPYIT